MNRYEILKHPDQFPVTSEDAEALEAAPSEHLKFLLELDKKIREGTAEEDPSL